jgi:hypothetical protein
MRTFLIILSFTALAACSGGPGAPPDSLPEPVCVPNTDSPFVGLTEEEAYDLAATQGLTVRVVGRDGECFAVTLDLRDDRINLELVAGVVVGADVY